MKPDTGTSEFGRIVGSGHGGLIIVSDNRYLHNPNVDIGDLIFISSSYNPLTSAQLREIADFMDALPRE